MSKIAKQILSFFLVVIMMFGAATPGISAVVDMSLNAKAVSNYSATAAAKYAMEWWNGRNNDIWSDYDKWGGDCANFISQCLYAGGIPMTPKWYFHKRTGPNPSGLSTERTESFTMVNGLKGHTTEDNRSLYRYLISIGGQVIKNPSASDVSVGDVLFYDWEGDGFYNHVAICVDIVNGIPKVACHYSDRCTENWTIGAAQSNMAVIKLYGTPCVNSAPSYDVYKVTAKSIILRSDASTSSAGKGVSAGVDFILHVTETKNVNGYTWGKCKVKGVEGWLRLTGYTRYITHVDSIPVDHVWGDWYVVTKPTCVDKGLEKRNCKRCGLEQQRETACGGHKEVRPATCLEASYCSACGALVSPALGHSYGSWQTHIPATCLEGGQDKHICTRCGHTEYKDSQPLGHDHQPTVKLPFCETEGETVYKCTRCNDSYTDKSTWSAWTTLDDPSVLSKYPSDVWESKTQYRYQDRYYTDAYEETKTTNPIPAGDNYIVKTKEIITKQIWYQLDYYCTRTSNQVRHFRTESINGQYSAYGVDSNYGEYHLSTAHGEVWVTQETLNSLQKVNPGERLYASQGGINKSSQVAYAYEYNPQLKYTAPCFVMGEKTEEKKVVEYYKSYINWTDFTDWSDTPVTATNDRKVETRTVYRFKQAALNHDDVYSTVQRTCYEDGCTRATCQRCGRTYDTEIVPKGNHVTMGEWYQWTPENSNDPDIVVYRRDCKTTPGCDYYELKELKITRKVVEPNCTAEGYTLVTITDSSGKVVAEYEEEGSRVPALGHDMSEFKMILPPTCTEKGQSEAKCRRDGCKHKEYKDIDPLGHIEVVDPAIAPTCTITGLTQGSHCSRCDKVVVAQEVVPATGHNMGEWKPYSPEEYVNGEIMCGGMGTDRRFCQNQNCEYYEDRHVDGPEHNFVVVDSKDATCTLPGFIQKECSRCGLPDATFTIEPLGHIKGDEYTVYPTCLDDGFTGWDCQREGCDHTEKTKQLPATDHNLKEEYHPSTCTTGGYWEYSCQNTNKNTNQPCGYYYIVTEDQLGHEWGDWEVVTPATCDAPGMEKRECIRHDAEETRVINPIGHNYKPTKVEADCLNNGGTTYVCQNDSSHTYTDDIVPALGHDWGKWETVTEPGCITEGVKKHICNRDSSHVETDKIPALGHTPVTDNGKPATCLDKGITEGAHCSVCKTTLTAQEDIPALGHDWGEWDIKEPTCTEDGYKKHICNRDSSHVEQEPLKAPGHTTEIIPGVAPTCLDDGLTEGLVCTTCKEVLVAQEVIPALDHDWGEWQVISASSCVAEGKEHRVCKRDASHVDYRGVAKDPHPIVIDEGYSATCENTGLTEGSHCSSCNEVLVAQEVIPALGHDWSEWTRVEPSCLEDGYEKRVCKRDPSHVEQVVIPATGHIPVTDEAVPATCLKTGLTEGSHCSACDEILVEQTVTPVLGHDWGDWETITAPDCLTDGEQKRVCHRDASHVEKTKIPALGHDAVIDAPVDATCLKSGKTAGSHCSACDAVIEKAEYIAPLGHDWGAWDIKNPTCEEDGYEKRVCERDSSHKEEKTLEATGHSSEAVRGKTPTCLETGLTEGSVCSTCDKVLVEQEIIPKLGHDWGEWEDIDSDCVNDGSNKRVCNRDSSHTEEKIIPAKGHTVVEDEGKAATCESTGLTGGSHCSVCDETIVKQEVIPELGHDWGEWNIKEPTCEEDGYKDRVCKRDPSHTEHEDLLHTEHTVVIDKAVPPTCLETGLTEGSHCSGCNEVIVAQEVVPALDHDWGDWKITTEAGCITNGERKAVCNRDASHIKTEVIPAKGHTSVSEDAIPATCLNSGKTEGSHCSVCNAVIKKAEYIAPLGHDWGEWDVKDPTCTEDGYEHRVCKRDPSHVEHEDIKALGHSAETIPAVEPTCEDTGLTEGSVCSTCDKVLVEQEVVPALGHDWGEWEEINSDCINDGSRKRVCNRDISHIQEEVIPAAGHVIVTDPGKDPTCEDAGLTEGSHCSTCKEIIVKQQIIPALGHDWGEWDIKEPTCTEEGYKNRVCNRDSSHTQGEILYAKGHTEEIDTGYSATCEEPGLSKGSHCSECGEVLAAQEVIPALGHDWGEWHIINKPDCLNEGNQERICNRDNSHVEKLTLPPLGHTVVIDPAVEPTCTQSGSTAGSHCSVCDGVIEKVETIDPLGHEMGEWYIVTPADYGVEGLEQCDCIRGDKSETRPIPALIKNTYTATFVIGDEIIGTVTFEEGAKSIDEPPIPEKDNYIGRWDDYVLGNENIVIEGHYEPKNSDNVSDLEKEKTAEYKDGIAKITLSAHAQTKAINILSEKTKPVDVVLVLDQSGSMDEAMGKTNSEKKINALLKSANAFVDSVYDNAVATGADHRVAIVGFAYSDLKEDSKFVNTEIITTLDGEPIGYTASGNNSAYKNALMPIMAQNGEINPLVKGVITSEKIVPEGATAADAGLDMAKRVFSNNPIAAGEERERIVLFITDGVPTAWGGEQYSAIKLIPNDALKIANEIKNSLGAKIYSVGISEGIDPAADFKKIEDEFGCYNINRSKDTASFDFNRFLHYVSSNYPDATAMDFGGTGDKASGFYLAATETDKLQSIFSDILYSSVYAVTTFDKVSLIDTVSAEFTMTMEQEDAFRANLAAEKGLGDENITITRNADGTTTIRVDNVKAEKVYDEEGKAYYRAEVSFEVTANKNALDPGKYETNTDDAGIMIDGVYVEKFDVPTIIITEPRNIVVFTINGNVYRIDEGKLGDSITVPESDLAKWDIPDDAVITESYMEIEASEICADEYTIVWKINDESIVTKHKVGTVIEPIEVAAPSSELEFAGWSPALRNTMPAMNLVYTATFKSTHEHEFVETGKSGDCESGIITYKECACGEKTQSVSASSQHTYKVDIDENSTDTIDELFCTTCGKTDDRVVKYTCAYKSWRPNQTIEMNLYEDDIQVQLEDEKIYVKIPIESSLRKKTFVVKRTNADGTTDILDSRVENGCLVFEVDHFSIYNILAVDDETGLPVEEPTYEQSVCALHGHKTETTVVAPTCERDGYTKHLCTNCGYFTYTDEVPATGHTYTDTTVKPDCTHDGYVEHVCDSCGHTFKDNETVSPGHSYATEVTAPTCTLDGYTTYICSACGHTYKGDEVEKTGHKYKTTVVEATCTAAGYTLNECENCGTDFIDNHTASLGHSYVDTVVESTCTSEGYTSHVCSRCSYTYVDSTTASAGHSYVSTVVAATCTQGGYTVNECSACGHSYKSDETAAKGHTPSGDWVVKDGKHVQLCADCNEVAHSKDIVIDVPDNVTISGNNLIVFYKMSDKLDITVSEGKLIYQSADPRIAVVDENGKVTGLKTGSTTITAVAEGSDTSVTINVQVRYTWWQWIIMIFFLGFLWY
ncbi:MAG: amidase domain-containing protein [Clostridia bacterium]|nr:amidase domain-containing protein [Clostridia bacterium]